MFTAYKKYWKQYADFSGRSSRSDYWWVVLCNILITLPLNLIVVIPLMAAVFNYMAELEYGYTPNPGDIFALSGLGIFFLFVLGIFYLATFIPSLAITVRRLRDANFHWAFIFLGVGPSILCFIPILDIIGILIAVPCWIALLVLLCQGSKPGVTSNNYGQQFGQQTFQGQQFGQQPQQGGFQGQQFGQQPQQPVSDQSQAVEQTEPVQNPFTAETPEHSTPEDFGTQAPVEDNPFVSPIQEEKPFTPVENSVDDATENQE